MWWLNTLDFHCRNSPCKWHLIVIHFWLEWHKKHLKKEVHPQNENCHYLCILHLFQTCLSFFLLFNTNKYTEKFGGKTAIHLQSILVPIRDDNDFFFQYSSEYLVLCLKEKGNTSLEPPVCLNCEIFNFWMNYPINTTCK